MLASSDTCRPASTSSRRLPTWSATTNPCDPEFDLTVHLVDEQAEQERPRLKIEEVRVPAEAVAGDSFHVHYRVGNLGGDLAPGGYAVLYVVGPRVFKRHRSVAGALAIRSLVSLRVGYG